jgi:hypothetical protein
MLGDAKVMAIVPVHDLGKARTFWEKMVGLTPKEVHDPEGEVMYLLNDTALLVYRTSAELGGATKVSFLVKDLVQEMESLKNHGVVFEDVDLPGLKTVNGMVEGPRGKAAWFKDLEDNWIGLMQE